MGKSSSYKGGPTPSSARTSSVLNIKGTHSTAQGTTMNSKDNAHGRGKMGSGGSKSGKMSYGKSGPYGRS